MDKNLEAYNKFKEKLDKLESNPDATAEDKLEAILIKAWMMQVDDRYNDLQGYIDYVLWQMKGSRLTVETLTTRQKLMKELEARLKELGNPVLPLLIEEKKAIEAEIRFLRKNW